NTTLMNERAGLGSGGGSAAAGAAVPGTVGGNLSKRVGDFVTGHDARRGRRGGGGGGGGGLFGASSKMLIDLAKGNGASNDPTVRQGLVKLHTLAELGRFNNLRVKAAKAAGRDIPGMPNIAKLSMSEMTRLSRDLGLQIIGPYGMLHAYDPKDR